MSKQHSRWLAFKLWAGLAARGRAPTAAVKPKDGTSDDGRLFKQTVGGSVGSSGGTM